MRRTGIVRRRRNGLFSSASAPISAAFRSIEPNKGQQGPDWPGGWFCPCHGSKYDLAGRVYKDVPAPYNLPAPPYRLMNAKTLRIGENPPGETFNVNSVTQM